MRKLIFASTLLLFAALPPSAQAAVVETQVERVFTASTQAMQVSESHTTRLTTSGYRIESGTMERFVIPIFIRDGKEQEKLAEIKQTLTVTSGGQKTDNYLAEISDSQLIVSVPFPRTIRFGDSHQITLNYQTTELIKQSGALIDIYLIPFAKNYQFSSIEEKQTYVTMLRIPKEFGELNFAIPSVTPRAAGEYLEFDIPTSELIGRYGWLQFGTQQFYRFLLTQEYQRSDRNPLLINTYELVIPRDIKARGINQRVFYEQLIPTPSYIRTDEMGNLIAVYKIPANQSGELTVSGYAELTQAPLDLTASGNLADIPTELVSLTKGSKYWEVEAAEIQAKAKALQGSEQNVYKLVMRTYQDIVSSIDYADVQRFGITERQGALATLKGGGAVCMEYSDLFITLLRTQGVPARAAYGFGYDNREIATNQVGHQWAEVYFPALQEWVAVDVTWGESGQTLIGGDLNHFYTHIAEANPDDPPQIRTRYFGIDPTNEASRLTVTPLRTIPQDTVLLTSPELVRTLEVSNERPQSLVALANLDRTLVSYLARQLGVSLEIALLLVRFLYIFPLLLLGLAWYWRRHKIIREP